MGQPLRSSRERATARRRLLKWYDESRRALPWRVTTDPYAIWLSEVMLQQTTVRTVEPRWSRFLQRWPTVGALAGAPLEEVLHEWTGLGYYARARNLHKAARKIVEEFDGRIPATFESLRSLPGMGPYTAAAVASIAFGEPVAVLDANVERVLARLYALDRDARSTPGRQFLKDRAAGLLCTKRPGDFNQAMMELGATVCLPRVAHCRQCPLEEHCEGRRSGDPLGFPRRKPREPMEEVREAAVLIRSNGAVLLLRRPHEASFGGMWELPRLVCHEGEEGADAARRAAREIAGLDVDVGPEILRLKHTVMRRRITLRVYPARRWSGRVSPSFHEEANWFPAREWAGMPKSTTQKKICDHLLGAESRGPGGGAPPDENRFL